MKKIIYTFSAFLPIVFGVVSCNSKDENIFEKSSTDRMQDAINQYHKLLTESTHGWIFENYPGGSSQDMGGFTHTLVFTENEVTAMLDISKDAPKTSTYSIIPYGGAMLSFDQNNPLLHAFNEPNYNYIDGFRGDFEFVFVSHTEDEIIVRGKRYNDKMRMIRLKEPAADYMAKVRNIANTVEQRGVKSITISGKEIDFSKGGRIISYEDESGKVVSIPFNFTDGGIRFYAPLQIGTQSVQEIIFDSTTSTFKDQNNIFAMELFVPSPINFSTSRWRFFANNPAQVSSKLLNQYNEVFNEMKTEVSGTTLYLWERYMLGNSNQGAAQGVGLYFWNGLNPLTPGRNGYGSMYHLEFFGNSENANLLHIRGRQSSEGPNFQPLLKIRKLLIDSSPYLVEKISDTPEKVKLTSQKDADVWLIMEKYWSM